MKKMELLFAFGYVCVFACVPGYSAGNEVRTATAKSSRSDTPPIPTKTLKIDGTDVDINLLIKKGQMYLSDIKRQEMGPSGKKININYMRRLQYFPNNKHIALIESKVLSDEAAQGYLKVYTSDGRKVFEATADPEFYGDYMEYELVAVVGDHHVAAVVSKYIGTNRRELVVYKTGNHEVVFSTGFLNGAFFVSPSENYIVLSFENPQRDYTELYKYDFSVISKMAEGSNLSWSGWSNDGKNYVLTKSKALPEKAPSGQSIFQTELQLFTDDVLKWRNIVNSETLRITFSKSKYVVARLGKNYKTNEHGVVQSFETEYVVFNISSGAIEAKGDLSPKTLEGYTNE